jgi:hypothetical protein
LIQFPEASLLHLLFPKSQDAYRVNPVTERVAVHTQGGAADVEGERSYIGRLENDPN